MKSTKRAGEYSPGISKHAPTNALISCSEHITFLRPAQAFPPSRRGFSWSPAYYSPGHQESTLLVAAVHAPAGGYITMTVIFIDKSIFPSATCRQYICMKIRQPVGEVEVSTYFCR